MDSNVSTTVPLKGIKIGSEHYKISQFADDTSLLLGTIKEIKYAFQAIKKWCRATCMKENVKAKEKDYDQANIETQIQEIK